MTPTELLAVLCTLVAVLGIGTIAHELSHATVLRTIGVPYEIEWLPARDRTGLVKATALGTWASVTPRTVPADAPEWGLRVAALAPLVLAAPGGLVFLGVLPDPTTVHPVVTAAAAAWLACAIPSPSDFSVVFHGDRATDR